MESMRMVSPEKDLNRKKRLLAVAFRMGQFLMYNLQIHMRMSMDRSQGLLNDSNEEEGGLFA
jgi:hypothetical protein